MLIGTHNGAFHADDVFAVALIKLFINKDIEVVRTRDINILEKCDMVVDVGGKYDGIKYFDHHQRDFNITHPEGPKLASVGLVLRYLRDIDTISSDEFEYLREEFLPIDAGDNGFVGYDSGLLKMVDKFNVIWDKSDDLEAVDAAFDQAVEYVEQFIYRVYEQAKSAIKAKTIIENTKKKFDGKSYIIYDKSMPGIIEAVIDEKLVCIYPGTGDIKARIVADSPGSFDLCVPKAKIDEAVSLMKSEPLFVHNNRFILAFREIGEAIEFAKKLEVVTEWKNMENKIEGDIEL